MRSLVLWFIACLFPEVAQAQDAAWINQEITDTADAGGGTVTLAGGVYDLEAAVVLRSGVTLRGGGATVLRAAPTLVGHVLVIEAGASHAGLRDLTVDGENQPGSKACLFSEGGLSNVIIETVHIVHCKRQGMFFDGAEQAPNTNIRIERYGVSGTGSHGILMHHSHDAVVIGGTVEAWAAEILNRPAITVGRPGARAIVAGNLIRNAAGPNAGGISVDHLNGGIVDGNLIESVTSWGVEIVDLTRDIAVTGNTIRHTGAQGVAIHGNVNGTPNRITISGNLITGAGDNGVRATKGANEKGSVQLTISGNSICNSASRGIWVMDAREVTVVSNVVRLSGLQGLLIQNSSSYVASNILTGNGQRSQW